jgi:hypothetical protein
MTSTPENTESLGKARELALAALHEVTPAASVGEFADHEITSDGVMSLRFETRLAGYPGWFWTVALAAVPGAEPTVLELELLPGDDALVAPEWIPWSQRLEDFKAQQALAAQDSDDDGEDSDDDDAAEADDDEFDDDDDHDDDGEEFLHAGDVDIDELDDEPGDEEE